MTDQPGPLPLVVIGGYLGAGKTTLLNRLLSDPDAGPMAVVVNDFGDIDIDSMLIESHDGDTISLANGCVCCSLADGFVLTLARLRERADDFDRVVVEVSGVGDPWKVAQWGRTPGFRLDSVVVLADAETVIERARDRYVGDTVRGQLAGADVVVVTKVDLVDEVRVGEVRSWLGTVTDATVVTGAAAVGSMLFAAISSAGNVDRDPRRHAHHVVASRTFAGALDSATFNAVMADRPDGLLRVKGRVVMAGPPERPVRVQVVGRRVEITAVPGRAREQDAISALVVVASPGTSVGGLDEWLDRFER